MFKNTPVISLIPARGGSKGIPLKNLAIVLGKPMIFHTLKASRLSKIIDKTYISTDNNKIIKYLEQFDANIIKRPKNISKDKSSASSVVSHFLKTLAEMPFL